MAITLCATWLHVGPTVTLRQLNSIEFKTDERLTEAYVFEDFQWIDILFIVYNAIRIFCKMICPYDIL